MDGLDEQPKQQANPTRALLARALQRARGSLLWERLWPALATLATALGLFLAFSWAGLWLVLPPIAHAVVFFVFAVVIAVAALPLVVLRVPSATDGLRRLDRSSGESHRPATAVADEIAANQNDPVAQALWRAHVERALMSARKLKAGWPQPRLADARSDGVARAGAYSGGCRASSPPAASAGNASPPPSTGAAWSRRRISVSTLGSRRRSIPAGRRSCCRACAPAKPRRQRPRSRCRPAANLWCARPAMCVSTSCAKAARGRAARCACGSAGRQRGTPLRHQG